MEFKLRNKENEKRISKFMSYVLRHNPQSINIKIDNNGWVLVDELIKKSKYKVNLDIIKYVVENNDKKRFAFNEDFTKIRANQGHSLKIDLEYLPVKPPDFLYHGTADKFFTSIQKKGLLKRNRHHVHLSTEKETAYNVGKRHGKPIVLKILSQKMYEKGFQFFISENGVWLTNHVPYDYIFKL